MNKILLLLCLAFSLGLVRLASAQAAPAPRLHQRFDAGWRFHRGDAPGAEEAKFADAGWRRVDLPHDWSIEDLPPVSAAQTPSLAVTAGSWRFALGDDPAWKYPAFDDTAWQTVTLPTHWSTHLTGDLTQKFGWYRRRIDIPQALRGKDILLLLGKIDDADETFVNGVKVGGTGSFPPHYETAWTDTRRYLVPARLLKGDGTDVAAVRDYNGAGDAGIYEAAAPPDRHGPFDADSESGAAQGFTLGGVGWYRKTFPLPAGLKGKRPSVTFDGVYMDSQVWFNGHLLGAHPYGYTGFTFDLTPYARTTEGGTALFRAAGTQSVMSVQFLLDHGADVNARTRTGETPLMVAAGVGDIASIRLMLDRGADVNAKDKYNKSALKCAIWGKQLAVARLLKWVGAR